jgi:Uma2 family endonuclease
MTTIDSPINTDEVEINVPHVHSWNLDEYYRLDDLGFFGYETHVELIEGEIIDKVSPQSKPHAYIVNSIAERCILAFGEATKVRIQSPISLSASAEPEPDIAVVLDKKQKYLQNSHPQPEDILLILEASESSLDFDRKRKAALYAKAGIVEYSIVNLMNNKLEVYREPNSKPGYDKTLAFSAGDIVSTLARPEVLIAAADILP